MKKSNKQTKIVEVKEEITSTEVTEVVTVPEQLGKYVNVVHNDLNFSDSFFIKPEIKSLKEYGIDSIPKFEFGTFAGNTLVNFSDKVFDNNKIIQNAWRIIKEKYPTAKAICKQHDEYSGELLISFPDLQREVITKKDIINPALLIRNSYTGIFDTKVSFCYERLICSNGARRKTLAEKTDLPVFIHDPLTFITMMESESMNEFAKVNLLAAKQILRSDVESRITEKVSSLGYAKKDADRAHFLLDKESESLGQPINAWLVYNAFNNALYKSENSQPMVKRDKIDSEIFNYLLELN